VTRCRRIITGSAYRQHSEMNKKQMKTNNNHLHWNIKTTIQRLGTNTIINITRSCIY